jgi:mannitol-1-phosphate 5-dehydrogenase
MKLVQFGAGRIGRSFIGQIFSRAGWQVVFIDQDSRIVSLLNEKKEYRVVIKREKEDDEVRLIGPVSALDIKNADAVIEQIAAADILATSVGQRSFPVILPFIAEGLKRRPTKTNKPLDIIIAENARTAVPQFKDAFSTLPGDIYSDKKVGLIETSIGKMVPIMSEKDLVEDPLRIFTEEYETLIVDKQGFRGPIPDIPEIFPVDSIAAYVDRKLFIHNLSHAAIAYLGFKAAPETDVIDRALLLPGVEEGARKAVHEAAAALVAEYPHVYSRADMDDHIEDLFLRYRNSALNGSLYWAGRDIPRKLAKDDRITAPMLLCAKYAFPFDGIARVYRAGVEFAKPDESGRLFPADEKFRATYLPSDIRKIPVEVSGLDISIDADKKVMEILSADEKHER